MGENTHSMIRGNVHHTILSVERNITPPLYYIHMQNILDHNLTSNFNYLSN